MHDALDSQSVKAALITLSNPWRSVDVLESIDSTNLEALRDPRAWRVVVSDYQSAGRGRLARQWRAPAGTSIAVSAVVPVPAGNNADLGWLPLLSGMAMRSALADVAAVSCRLKWPNDVMAREPASALADRQPEQTPDGDPDGMDSDVDPDGDSDADWDVDTDGDGDGDLPWLKISGVLCEMAASGDRVVIGAGANVSQQRSELPVGTATSLALCGAGHVRREDLIVSYLGELADLHGVWSAGGAGLADLRMAYRSCCLTIGLEVDVHEPDGRVVRGTATGVDDAGRLVVATRGASRAHSAGDVVHVRRSKRDQGHTA